MDPERSPLQRISIIVERARLYLRVPRKHEALYRKAGEEITRTVRLYKAKYPNQSEIPSGGYLAMAAVDIAVRQEEVRQALEAKTEQLQPRLQKINEALENLIHSSCDLLQH